MHQLQTSFEAEWKMQGGAPEGSCLVSSLLLLSHSVTQHFDNALVHLAHKVLRIQDGIERLCLQQMLSIDLLHICNQYCAFSMIQGGMSVAFTSVAGGCSKTDAGTTACDLTQSIVVSAMKSCMDHCLTAMYNVFSPGTTQADRSRRPSHQQCEVIHIRYCHRT